MRKSWLDTQLPNQISATSHISTHSHSNVIFAAQVVPFESVLVTKMVCFDEQLNSCKHNQTKKNNVPNDVNLSCRSFFKHRLPELTEEDARSALLDYVSSRYCYGKRPAKEMRVIKIDNTCAFHVSMVQRDGFQRVKREEDRQERRTGLTNNCLF